MLNNYSSWEVNSELSNPLDNDSVYNVALISAILTIVSTALLNLTVIVLVLALVYYLQKRWIIKSLSGNIYVQGAQYTVYGLMLSEILKYFCVLLWTFTFHEWEELRLILNISCMSIGCLLGGVMWLRMRNKAQKIEIKAVFFSTFGIIACLGSISVI